MNGLHGLVSLESLFYSLDRPHGWVSVKSLF
uniref:Uncharacterized protein n=1 Tax=Anguilla anguilla TaxID=7936 RepID=A0A0E9SC35_ANGAN